ncbi:MAG: tetratricopeptide repeat protein, partial [Anaerolineae bacterium]|nr:tetratricopeptide repeat protein [Anaerolineae bacterium]
MPEISLREYEIEIDQLIEEARYLEALAHLRHIVSQYPRYLEAYYLMGKMLLEADQPNLAVDMFRRALNADPEHLKSRIGLGLAHEQRDDLNAAIWNLERAFELAPANADIAEELRRIYGRRDGKEPAHIPISRAGLARLYMRGNLSNRAVVEFRHLLESEPNRPDLLGALAEAYWRDGQIVQASETCQEILDDMPYHWKANLLLGTLWLNSGQEEGQTYLNRSQEVDI